MFLTHARRERPSWFRDDPYTEIDMWVTPDESSAYIIGVYRRACRPHDVVGSRQ